MGGIFVVDDRPFAEAPHAAKEELALSLGELGAASEGGIGPFGKAVIQWQHVVFGGFDQPKALQLLELLWLFLGQIAGLTPIVIGVIELPNVVIEGGKLNGAGFPGGSVACNRGPALVIDAAVANHLEVLGFMPLGCILFIKGIEHAHAFQRFLLHPIHEQGLGQSGRLQHRGG